MVGEMSWGFYSYIWRGIRFIWNNTDYKNNIDQFQLRLIYLFLV
jgi:hypothetical protein